MLEVNKDENSGAKRKLSSCSINEDGPKSSLDANNSHEYSNKWNENCQIVAVKPESTITGFAIKSRYKQKGTNKKIKIMCADMRSELLSNDVKEEIQTSWKNSQQYNEKGVEIITNPFKVCVVNDFLLDPGFLNGLREEFNDVQWNFRNMDLYEFFQSEDLKHLRDNQFISSLYNFLKKDVMMWIAELTGLQLTHISATCSLYTNTDYLLVHDDQRGDRMVAFILYLPESGGWNQSQGGALQLLNKNSDGQPFEGVRDIFPANNKFIFFPVTSDSYHQVAEVTSFSDCRLSINGWFHTNVAPVFETPVYKPHPGLYSEKQYQAIDFDCELSTWLTSDYVECNIINQIQEYFEENSEIRLKQFLREEPLNAILEILKSGLLKWHKIGPPNRYSYEILDTNDLPQVLDRFLKLLQSKLMFSLLKRYTGLELDQESSYMKFEFQRWRPGFYSLLNDYDWHMKKELDFIITFGCKKSNDVIGGRVQYISTDEEVQDALITLEPEENSLNLVYRDTARFTKYFSKSSKCQCFYMLICSYSE